jgi:hypothetical protein
MEPAKPERHFIRDAIFLDIPYIVDSVCRHFDYRLNRLHRYDPASGAISARPYMLLPPFFFFLLILLYSAYGATLSALCGVFGAHLIEAMRNAIGKAFVALAFIQFVGLAIFVGFRIEKRFNKAKIDDGWRKAVVWIVLLLVLGFWSAPWYFLGKALQDSLAFDTCRADTLPGLAVVQLVAFAVSAGLTAVAAFKQSAVWLRILWQVLILAIMTGGLWMLPDIPMRSEAGQVPYHHLYAVIALGFAFTALIASCLVHIPFFSMTANERLPFKNALRYRELFPDSRTDPLLSPRRIIGGGVIGVLHKPLQFLLLPAFAVILVPTGFLWHACVLGSLASILLIIASNLTSRWDQMSQYLRRYFLLGSPLAVSASVIVIAFLRLTDVQYVATVLNVAPFGVLFAWMLMAYVLGWWFEYQVNSILATQLLKIFGTDGRTDNDTIRYVPAVYAPGPWSRVALTDRYLAAHSTGEFVITGWFRESDGGKLVTAFNTFGFIELFSKLLEQKDPDSVHELGRRIQLYFALVNAVLLIGFATLFWHHGRGDKLNTVAPVVVAHQQTATNGLDLSALLTAQSDHAPPAIVVAASGGGTRAALYTATVMQGLHNLKADENVVLLSGVSGGGVAAAYFASHRASLLSGMQLPCGAHDQQLHSPWQCYLDRMSMPFIRDVLQGAGEWRIQSEQPLGILLAESFDRRLFADEGREIGNITQTGLILNTTITGHPVTDAPALQGGFIRIPPASFNQCADQEDPISALAGGRLAFTNLNQVDAFAKSDPQTPGINLPFVVIQDQHVPLSGAAALNANFPPVFPNARVDVMRDAARDSPCAKRSYYVTDGGGTENLGLVSALLALQSALENIAANNETNHQPITLRNIEIVLAEASAMEYDYHQDRGIGAATGQSKERLTGRLTLELIDQVERAAHAIDPKVQIRIHDLSLPRVFRSRGGFGTHWMFPEFVRVTDPLSMPLPPDWQQTVAQYTGLQRYWVTLDRTQLITLWQGLYDPATKFCDRKWQDDPADDLTTVSNWICGHTAGTNTSARPDAQLDAWQRLRETLIKQPTS